MFDTIVAIASGNSNQAISIIRISGDKSFSIIKKIFTGKIQNNKTISYGKIINETKSIIDEVLVAFFEGKENFVGEPTIEIYAHGGVVVTNMILQLIIANGARVAERGEFSKRAFLNGKIDLVKADAINDLINAKNIFQAQKSAKQFESNLSNKIANFIEEILYIIATCETNIDYPEYDDVEILNNENIKPKINYLIEQLSDILIASKKASSFYNGIKIAIVGKPNVGKSSLLNVLIKEDKAIVTDVEGTTTDVVEANFQINGFLFLLQDTAGVRDSLNKIEEIGIQKTLKTIEKSEVIIHVVDASQDEFNDFDIQIQELSKNKQYYLVYNKKDKVNKQINQHNIYISAKENDIHSLEKQLYLFTQEVDLEDENIIFSNRQIGLVGQALNALKESLIGINNGFEPDVIIVDLREAWEALENISGRADNELLLDKMFKNFCLGK